MYVHAMLLFALLAGVFELTGTAVHLLRCKFRLLAHRGPARGVIRETRGVTRETGSVIPEHAWTGGVIPEHVACCCLPLVPLDSTEFVLGFCPMGSE